LSGLEGYACVEDIENTPNPDDAAPIVMHLRRFGVFFAGPLDLDYAMLEKFPDAYMALEDGERGPQNTDAVVSMFGTKDDPALDYWRVADRAERLRWFRLCS
jgi:hypothetical protein